MQSGLARLNYRLEWRQTNSARHNADHESPARTNSAGSWTAPVFWRNLPKQAKRNRHGFLFERQNFLEICLGGFERRLASFSA